MLSVGMLFCRAVSTAVLSRGLALTSPPPMRAATVISLINLVKSFPRRASLRAFLCLIELHFEWPDMRPAPWLPQGPRGVNVKYPVTLSPRRAPDIMPRLGCGGRGGVQWSCRWARALRFLAACRPRARRDLTAC